MLPIQNNSEIVLYQPENSISIEVLMENDTVWLTLDNLSELYQRNKSTISRHIKNIFKANYLSEFSTSAISIAEYSLYPYLYEKSLLSKYNEFLDIMRIKVIEINKEIAEKSASIKSQYKFFKTADSLQLATALVHNCELFITNDKQLRQFSDIETLILDDLL